jgi:hypothetical protein
VPDRRLDGLASTQPALLLRTQALELAAVNDLRVRVVGVHAAEPQIDHDVLELDRHVLRQVRRLHSLFLSWRCCVRMRSARSSHIIKSLAAFG